MPPSTLKLYIDVAKLLMESGPLSLDQLSNHLKVNKSTLKQQMTFLVKQRIINKKESNPNVKYVIAAGGIRILKFFKVQPSIRIPIEKR